MSLAPAIPACQSPESAPGSRVVANGQRFIAFRCFGKAPMVGYRVQAVFYLLWLDRHFTLYEHS
jgi:hypothetical protein